MTAFVDYQIVKNMVWSLTFGLDNVTIRNDKFWDKISTPDSRFANLPVASVGQRENNTFNNSNTLQYTVRKFKNKHDFSVLLGQEMVELKYKQNTVETRYFPADISAQKALANMGLGSIPSGSTAQQPMPTSYISTPQRIFSIFSRLTYGYKDKYLLTFNVRSDRSSKFTPDNSLLVSPSGAIVWRISREKFIANINCLRDAKSR